MLQAFQRKFSSLSGACYKLFKGSSLLHLVRATSFSKEVLFSIRCVLQAFQRKFSSTSGACCKDAHRGSYDITSSSLQAIICTSFLTKHRMRGVWRDTELMDPNVHINTNWPLIIIGLPSLFLVMNQCATAPLCHCVTSS